MTIVGKKHWLKITLLVLAACAVIGLILSGILFTQNPGRTYASASLQFSFNGAGEGKAPNGYPFDVNGIFSEEVLEKALEESGLTGTYTTDQIKDNLTITGVYPDNIVKQMTAYTSLLDADAEQQATMADYHATQYSVVLYHDFDPKISGDTLKTLLNNLLTAYRDYFIRTSAFSLEKTDPIPELSKYDYSQQLQAIREAADQQSRFAGEMADQAPDFRKDRKGFDDIVVSYGNLQTDIDRMDASIASNTVSKDRERLQKQYEMEISSLNRELQGTQEEIAQVEELIASYEKDGILYVSTSGALQKVTGNASDTYDKLVAKRQELTDSITAMNADIAKYQAQLDDMTPNDTNTATQETAETETVKEEAGEVSTSVELTDAEREQLTAASEKQLETLSTKKDRVTSDFKAMLDAYARQEINENTVQVSGLKYKAPSLLSTGFIAKAVKTAGPICALGLAVCLAWMVLSRWRTRKAFLEH